MDRRKKRETLILFIKITDRLLMNRCLTQLEYTNGTWTSRLSAQI